MKAVAQEVSKGTISAPQSIGVQVGFEIVDFHTVPLEKVRRDNQAIQEKIQPFIKEQKRIRKASEIAAAKIILNA